MLPVSEEATTGTATGHFVDKTEKSTGKHGTKRESRRCPSLYARLFGPITGTDGGPVNFPYGLPSLWEIRAKNGPVLPTIFCCDPCVF